MMYTGRVNLTFIQPSLIAADVKVAQRDGAGIGNVVGLGKLVQAELGHDRVLDLGLGSPAAAGQGLLDSGSGVAEYWRPPLCRGEHDRPPCVGHQDRGARVAHVAVDPFQGN